MISDKIIKAYRKVEEDFRKAVQKEIDSLEIDFEASKSNHYIFIGDKKCEFYIAKDYKSYNYRLDIFIEEETIFTCNFRFNEHTGKAEITKVIKIKLQVL